MSESAAFLSIIQLIDMNQEKIILPINEQKKILEKSIQQVKSDLLPNPKINAIAVYGSIINGNFGMYKKRHSGRKYSDIDILILVSDDFTIPTEWKLKMRGETPTHSVYNVELIEGKYLIQYIVVPRKIYSELNHQKMAEQNGVPLKLSKSKHKHLIIFHRETADCV